MGKPEEEHEPEGPEASAVEDQAKTSRVGAESSNYPTASAGLGFRQYHTE